MGLWQRDDTEFTARRKRLCEAGADEAYPDLHRAFAGATEMAGLNLPPGTEEPPSRSRHERVGNIWIRQISRGAASSLNQMPSPCELARLYDDHAQALFAFLLDLTGNEADTRDLLQEIFIRLAREDHLLEAVRSERGFLIRMARNLALDAHRRRGARERKHEAMAAHQAESIAALDPDEATFQASLEAALAELPTRSARSGASENVDGPDV